MEENVQFLLKLVEPFGSWNVLSWMLNADVFLCVLYQAERSAYMKHLDKLYKKHDNAWFTPVELFKVRFSAYTGKEDVPSFIFSY